MERRRSDSDGGTASEFVARAEADGDEVAAMKKLPSPIPNSFAGFRPDAYEAEAEAEAVTITNANQVSAVRGHRLGKPPIGRATERRVQEKEEDEFVIDT
jgi:hypothetical protein